MRSHHLDSYMRNLCDAANMITWLSHFHDLFVSMALQWNCDHKSSWIDNSWLSRRLCFSILWETISRRSPNLFRCLLFLLSVALFTSIRARYLFIVFDITFVSRIISLDAEIILIFHFCFSHTQIHLLILKWNGNIEKWNHCIRFKCADCMWNIFKLIFRSSNPLNVSMFCRQHCCHRLNIAFTNSALFRFYHGTDKSKRGVYF